MSSSEPTIDIMRHTAAHVMAAAIQQLWPSAKFGVGPTTEKGFYYDVLVDTPLTTEDLTRIEEKMHSIVKAKTLMQREDWAMDKAIVFMAEQHQDFKVELLNLLKTKGSTAVAEETGDTGIAAEGGAVLNSVSFYRLGSFVDLCRGPHVESADKIGVVKLINVAGAYWRGDAKNPQLQRIYAFCFPTKDELAHAIWQHEQAKLRDHRRLGKDLEMFTFCEEIGPGLPLWLPNGTIIREELEFLAKQTEYAAGYQRVSTPQLTKENLFFRSGHLPYYAEDMYAPIKIEEENYYLRPMNCPFHHNVFSVRPRSYREMPMRVAEYGTVYRYEASGALSGLMRTRGFCQNDAHIYCRKNQAEDEFLRVMNMHADYYKMFGIEDFYMRLSLPDLNKLDKYVDEPTEWMDALNIIRSAMQRSGYPYKEAKGEAAFYGPKVDFMIRSVIGNEYAISTNQLDFLATKRFNLGYIGEDGTQHPVYVIHRAPLGSHERFVAFLLEHYAGAFPVWLAPIQARVIPISDRHVEYAEEVRTALTSQSVPLASSVLRVDMDTSNDRMQKKIRQAQLEKIPYMLIVGDREAETQSVSVRLRDGTDLGSLPLAGFIERIVAECRNRKDASAPAQELKAEPA